MNSPERKSPFEGTISRREFERLGLEWTALDNEFDSAFQEFVNNPGVKSPEVVEAFKAKQRRLFEIETELMKVAEGKVSIIG